MPHRLVELLGSSDREAAGRTMEAMLQMTTLDIGQLEAASRGDLAATTSH